VFVAGQIGLCPVNLNIIAGGIIPETRLSLRHVARILAAMTTNSGLYDIVTAICYVTNQKDIPTVEQQLNNYYEEQLKVSSVVELDVVLHPCTGVVVSIMNLPNFNQLNCLSGKTK